MTTAAHLNASFRQHLHFLLLELADQLANLERYFKDTSVEHGKRVVSREGYVDNLRERSRNAIFGQLQKSKHKTNKYQLQSAEKLVSQLYQLSQLSCQIVIDGYALPDSAWDYFPSKDCAKLVKRIRTVINTVEPSLLEADSKAAVQIAAEQQKLNKKLTQILNHTVSQLEQEHHLSLAAQLLFPIYAIRQMIDALGRLSDSLLSVNLGQKMNVSRYNSLSQIAQDMNADPAELNLETVAETRSGSAIGGVSSNCDDSDGYLAIYKEGDWKKVTEEKDGVQAWHDIYPGLAPKILSFNRQGSSASMLIEHLPGYTFERLLFECSEEQIESALKRLVKTLRTIWQETKLDQPVQGHFMQQLQQRLGSVLQVHPDFEQGNVTVCGTHEPSFHELVAKIKSWEHKLPAPFSVHIHGDFNLDNIIYDPTERQIHFIDLHRSGYMDYVQDVSVFMISIYRLQVMQRKQRAKLLDVATAFLKAIRRFAKLQRDTTFELRLALGLSRSFATSTRFILDPALSRQMFLRSRYLLQQIDATYPNKTTTYRLPQEDLFFE